MKTKILGLVLASLTALSASPKIWAQAESKGGGGGDASEMRIDEIRADILSWIKRGGAKDLKFPPDITHKSYNLKMKKILSDKTLVVGFVDNNDSPNEELRVEVDGHPKTCRGFYSKVDQKPHLLCLRSKFEKLRDADQYRLIHHEYAGLVLLERNDGAASDYEISNQLTDFLTYQKVLKLAVKGEDKRCWARIDFKTEGIYAHQLVKAKETFTAYLSSKGYQVVSQSQKVATNHTLTLTEMSECLSPNNSGIARLYRHCYVTQFTSRDSGLKLKKVQYGSNIFKTHIRELMDMVEEMNIPTCY